MISEEAVVAYARNNCGICRVRLRRTMTKARLACVQATIRTDHPASGSREYYRCTVRYLLSYDYVSVYVTI